jgi:hypothetical protein
VQDGSSTFELRGRPAIDEADFVFNVVFTPLTFRWLRIFTWSVIEQGRVRLRLVANGCPPDELRELIRFSQAHEPVVEVLQVAHGEILSHGAALDAVCRERDDGDWFCFVDSDVMARGPLLDACRSPLPYTAALTAGRPGWGLPQVAGRGTAVLPGHLLFDEDGFVYGSSYFAIYYRPSLLRVRDRWGVGFAGYRWPDLPVEVRREMVRLGRRFDLYDTAKVLNILLQSDGETVAHIDHPNLVHIGGMSVEYLCEAFGVRPMDLWLEWERSLSPSDAPVPPGSDARSAPPDPARVAALALRCLVRGEPLPPIPTSLDPSAEARLKKVLDELAHLVERYADVVDAVS